MHTQLLIIGGGPGGYETALLAAKNGIETTLVEASHVGGTCLNQGCIPTKTFCRNAEIAEELAKAEEFGYRVEASQPDLVKVVERKNQIVGQLRANVEAMLAGAGVKLIKGFASFVSVNAVDVDGEQISADDIIIATGSESAMLPIEGCYLPGVMTSREILNLEQLPKSLCIIGAGVIGLEFASIFRSFGCEVSIVEYAPEILPRFDRDLAKRLRQSLGKRGIDILTQAEVKRISAIDGNLRVDYLRKNKENAIEAEKVLIAIGRKANVEKLNLEAAGVVAGKRGITVDDNMRTNVGHIYAIGDVNGRIMLAHAATFQGIRALNTIMGKTDKLRLDVVPSAVFTIPEAATVGLTEEECKERGLDYVCKKSFFRANGKAVCMGEPDGFCKLIVAADGQLLGCHLYGAHSADIVQEVCALMTCGGTIDDLKAIIHSHPTLNEVIQSAAHS